MNDRDRLISLLKELFRFDKAELDFGIYRIMNQKKDEIENFINNDLVKIIDAEMDQFVSKDKELLEKKIEKIKNEAEDLGVNYKESKKYQRIKEKLDSLSKSKNIDTNVYNDIYRFFKRYYDNGDFLSKRRYSKDKKYAIPYNGEEVYLHWANNDQYYVKTTEEFDNYSFKKNWVTVNFKVVQAEEEKNNNKSDEDKYFLLKDKNYFDYDSENKEVNIYFEYRSLTKKENKRYSNRNTQADIRNINFKKLKNKIKSQTKDIYDLGWLIKSDKKANPPLKSHLYKYTTKNKSDYFIHKDLKGFLNRELDFFIKNEIMDIDAIGTKEEKSVETYLNKVRVIKNVSKKIIEFLAQIEEFQKKLFEKKKFVIDDEYCLTLDKVPEKIQGEIFGEILNNNNQIKEWEKLFKEEVKTKNDLYRNNKLKNLVIDTKHFDKKFTEKIISNYKNIDKEIEGLMINSENYQAMNLIKNKFKNKINCIYIDPPYNTKNDNFIYKDSYKHSSWISFLNERIKISYEFLNDEGVFFSSIDDNEVSSLNFIVANIFKENNMLPNVVVKRRNSQPNLRKGIAPVHDYLKIAAKNYNSLKKLSYVPENFGIGTFNNPDNDPRGPWTTGPCTNKGGAEYTIETPTGKKYKDEWRFSKDTFYKLKEESRLYFPNDGDGKPRYKIYLKEKKQEGTKPSSWWENVGDTQSAHKLIEDIFGERVYTFPKPVKLVERIIELSDDKNSYVLDYFAGSGTTAQATLSLNKEKKVKNKYLLIEMGKYFSSVTKDRIKKLMYSDNWKDGKPESRDGYSHIFKYQKLEQYEDTLENIKFESNNLRLINDYDDYLIKYMLDYETKSSVLNIDKFDDPFNYKITITENKEKIDKKVNLVETFNYLIGLKVKTFDVYNQFNRKYKVISGKKDDESVLVIWRKTIDLDLKTDKDFIENNLNIDDYKKVYINGDNYVENSLLIEESFKKLMLND